jgi:oxygen-dependent protoporphyrinogen oxidase
MISSGDRLLPVPEGFVLMRPTRVWQVFKSPLLSWRGKVRLARERWIGRRTDDSDESLASFVRRRLGIETLERIVQPLVGGIYTADAEKLSMKATMPQFVKMEREHGSLIGAPADDTEATRGIERNSSGARYGQFRVFPEGMGRLFDEIRGTLHPLGVRKGNMVERLSRTEDGGWEIAVSGQPQTHRYDGVVLAIPAATTADLIQDVAPESAAAMKSIEYASSAIVLLGVRNDMVQRMPKAFGFVCPAIDGRSILAASFASHKFPNRAPSGHTLIRVFIGGATQPELLEKTDAELIAIAKAEMRQLIGLNSAPVLESVQRWNRAMPQYHVGHLEKVERVEKELATISGLEICGNGLRGVGIAPVVGGARRAAERLLEGLK